MNMLRAIDLLKQDIKAKEDKHKKYLDDVIVHLYARNTPLQGIDFF